MNKKISLHLAALASATAGAAVANNADAAIVYSGLVNINIPSTTAGVYLNVVTGVFSASPASAPGWDVNPWSGTALNMFSSAGQAGGASAYAGTGTTYFNLASGAPIGPASTFSGTGTATVNAGTPLNLNSSNNIIGFRFVNELNGNSVHYGWMRIALGGTPGGQPRSIVEYAYESTPGTAIAAKAIPTPGAVSLLAVGAAGLVGRRRRA